VFFFFTIHWLLFYFVSQAKNPNKQLYQ